MKRGALTVIKNMGIKSKEKVLILTDKKMLKIGKVLYKEAKRVAPKTSLVTMELTGRDGKEPPKRIANMMKKFDVILAPTFYSLSHTKARREACETGARIASMPRVTEFSFTKGGLTADYKKVNKLCKKMLKAVQKSRKVEVISPYGTKITMSVKGRKWMDDEGIYPDKGRWGNLPGGEVATAPLEGTANGKIFFNHFGNLGKDVTLIVKDGFVTEVKNSPKLEKIFKQLGKKARIIAEIGIGCNYKAKIIGIVLEDEKVYGTVHIAVGNNLSNGGKVDVPLHKDGIILKPTLIVDEKIIIDKEKWKI